MESEDSSSNDSFKSDEQTENKKAQDSCEALPSIGENEADSLNMSHNDLSDVSDLESGQSSDEKSNIEIVDTHRVKDLREKLDEKKSSQQGTEGSNGYDTKEKKTDEDLLDFEAEEGECNDEKEDLSHNKVSSKTTFVELSNLVGLIILT